MTFHKLTQGFSTPSAPLVQSVVPNPKLKLDQVREVPQLRPERTSNTERRTPNPETDRKLLFARPTVLSAARVRENWFSLSFIAAPSCQAWRRASTGTFCRCSGGFAPSPRAWAGGSGRAARQCARSSAIPGQIGPEEAGAGHKPAFKPAWKTTGLSRLAKTL
jgi:hypothetical protein